ncbi:hypothetical protein Q8W71_24465 [Methylobacterium sp. NEAU 140]|uniref:hypothetical protein n=1 Tax=Methylobacterium sp. NEAU 140 TaxID=3064945 RepID=UPI0027374172|nr:hypothetical protein [Methylobacterium sp. NEAU 140]MDP4025790.1 hypothetical protein [Methylobacterium sp. NEAU 140]
MNDATPNEVATQFGIAAALSFSAIAAPFVPEAILAYAGYRYLRHFTYGWRTWRAPARVPLHLGRRGYRDATTRRRGDASWPIGLAATGQVWLRREDLVQGLSLHGDDPEWQAQAIGALVFGACLNRMGAIVVQGAANELLTDQIAEVAKPFGRDNQIDTLNLEGTPKPPLRIATSTLAAAIADLRLGPEAIALNQALMPVLEMLATRYKQTPLALYGAFIDKDALARLVKGEYEIDQSTVSVGDDASVDAAALGEVLKPLSKISDEDREIGRKALEVHAPELAGLVCVSLTEGFELRDAIAAGGLVCIRPSTPLIAALVIARCVETLATTDPAHASRALVHIAYPDELSGASAKRFRAAATKAGAIGTLSLPARPTNHIYKATRKICALRIGSHTGGRGGGAVAGTISSTIKECSFTLDIQLPEAPEPTSASDLTNRGLR